MLAVFGDWQVVQPSVAKALDRLFSGEGEEFATTDCAALMPRSWQWLDGSAFSTHGDLMQVAFGLDPINTDKPLMYQGVRIGFSARPKMCRCPLSNMVLILKASSVLL
ncbi:hypothetical protein [Sphingorhabdus sp. YGSMI21]